MPPFRGYLEPTLEYNKPMTVFLVFLFLYQGRLLQCACYLLKTLIINITMTALPVRLRDNLVIIIFWLINVTSCHVM